MSSMIVLDNSFKTFKTLSPFIDALVNKCLRQSVPLSLQSKFQLVNVLKLALQVNFVYQLRHHKHVHKIVNYTEQLIVNYQVGPRLSFLTVKSL